MRLQNVGKVSCGDGIERIPPKIKLFFKYFIDAHGDIWIDEDDKYQFKYLKMHPEFIQEIESCNDLGRLMDFHRTLKDIDKTL